jgi:hypothetical protein
MLQQEQVGSHPLSYDALSMQSAVFLNGNGDHHDWQFQQPGVNQPTKKLTTQLSDQPSN